MESADIKINYYALTVAILTECSVETAFERLQSNHPDSVRAILTVEDDDDIRKFRARGLTFLEIASYYNAPWTTIYGRIRSTSKKEVHIGNQEAI